MAQYSLLMVLTVFVLATFVNILLVENLRNTSLMALRDSARAGTRVVDISDPIADADRTTAERECEEQLRAELAQINSKIKASGLTCEIKTNSSGHNYMVASMDASASDSIVMIPWAEPFRARLSDLSATYIPTERAK